MLSTMFDWIVSLKNMYVNMLTVYHGCFVTTKCFNVVIKVFLMIFICKYYHSLIMIS